MKIYASYDEHVIEGRKYKSLREYQNTPKSAYYMSLFLVRRTWPENNFKKDCGWIVSRTGKRPQKATYEEHIVECKKHPNAYAYTRAVKDTRFYSSTSAILAAWPSKNLATDVNW